MKAIGAVKERGKNRPVDWARDEGRHGAIFTGALGFRRSKSAGQF
jgi:hypothetical protein